MIKVGEVDNKGKTTKQMEKGKFAFFKGGWGDK